MNTPRLDRSHRCIEFVALSLQASAGKRPRRVPTEAGGRLGQGPGIHPLAPARRDAGAAEGGSALRIEANVHPSAFAARRRET